MMRKIFMLIGFSIVSFMCSGQQTYYNQTRQTQFLNPSYYGINGKSFAGVSYNSLSYQTNEKIDSKIFYGAVSFENANFSLGIDFNNFQINTYGLVNNTINLSYIYRVELLNDFYFLPSLSVGVGFNQIENPDLIFGDQLNLLTGSIATSSSDPLFFNELSTNFFDIGVSALVYNETFMFGVALKNLNSPDISYNQEFELKRPISFSGMIAYERDLNYFGRSFLPENSYLYLITSVYSADEFMKIYAGQELILGGFSIGLHQLYTKNKLSNAMLAGLNTSISFEQFEFSFGYNFPVSQDLTVFPPNVFEISMIIKFDRFLRNNKGFFKHLKTDNL